MENTTLKRRRALTTERAREVRQQGHDDALEFALAIGLGSDYQNDQIAKKDVVDLSGESHSVKGGVKKWQLFLYGLERFLNDPMFKAMNGVGQLIVSCIISFPEKYSDYESQKLVAKENLRPHMRAIAERLKERYRLEAFMNAAMFGGNEVKYLTIKHDKKFHVFSRKDVVEAFGKSFTIENSQARIIGQTPEQKVLFKYNGVNVAELEMRNDSVVHYRQVRFNMIKPKAMLLLFEKIPHIKSFNTQVEVYGAAAKTFGRWVNSKQNITKSN